MTRSSLHKYLYANANPVMNTDPSGYSALGLAVRMEAENTLRTSQIIYDSTIFNIGMNLLNKLWCIEAVEAVSYLAAEVLLTLVIDDALNERRSADAYDVAVEILQYALDNIEFICDEAGIASETIDDQIEAAIYEAKSKGKNENEHKTKKKSKKGKDKDDIPDRFRGEKPLKGESGKDAAKRILEKFGEYNPKDTGPGSDFNRLKKCFDTHYFD